MSSSQDVIKQHKFFSVFFFFFFVSTGNYQKALETYKEIHRKFPENVECNSSRLLHISQPLPDDLCLLNTVEVIIKRAMCVCVCLGLRFLVRLCTDMGLKEVQEYATKLKKVEKMKEIREQVCSLEPFILIIYL